MDFNEEQLINIKPLVLVRWLGIFIDVNALHSPNARTPILVTLLGKITDSNDSHTLNALAPILVTLSGITTDWIDVQDSNALSPMIVTEEPIAADWILAFVEITSVIAVSVNSPVTLRVYSLPLMSVKMVSAEYLFTNVTLVAP